MPSKSESGAASAKREGAKPAPGKTALTREERKAQKRAEAEARNALYAATKGDKKRLGQIERALDRKNARLAEIEKLLAEPDFYTREENAPEIIQEHGKLKADISALEEEWLEINEKLQYN